MTPDSLTFLRASSLAASQVITFGVESIFLGKTTRSQPALQRRPECVDPIDQAMATLVVLPVPFPTIGGRGGRQTSFAIFGRGDGGAESACFPRSPPETI